MKRIGNLFDSIVEYDNLRLATARALRGKRNRPDARQFVASLDTNLSEMRQQLLSGPTLLGTYRQFVIHDPKRRVITAPCFRERVLHHALMNVCEPVFERWLIDDTFACRCNRGREAAVTRAARFARRYPFFLKLDIRSYFDSIPHDVLVDRLYRLFKDQRLLNVFTQIVHAFRGETGRGLPIGSLSSQHFANFYLGWFDRQVKDQWRVPGYLRYMDDMLLWADSKSDLKRIFSKAEAFLRNELSLQLKIPSYLNLSHHGVDFLGCRIRSDGVSLNRRSRTRFSRKLRRLEKEYSIGTISENDLQVRGTALLAFTRAAGVKSLQFHQQVLNDLLVNSHKARTE